MYYDAAGRVVSTTVMVYDALGRRSRMQDARGNWTDYQYDALGRTVAVTDANGVVTRYAYDPVGNRTVQTRTHSVTSTQVITYQYDNANRMTQAGGVTYTWDNNGNLLNDGNATYSYDRANRLTDIQQGCGVHGCSQTWHALYNGDGVRVEADLQMGSGPVVSTIYVQDLAAPLPVILQARTGTTTTKYLYSVGTRPLAQNSTTWEYLLPDALGSVRQIVDANGNVTLAKSYEPYGTVLTSTGTASSIFGYAGEQSDTYIKLLFLRARYYSPETARFLSKDVWQGDYTRPQSLNAWAYVEGEPINHTDPSGQWALDLSNQQVYLVAEEGDSWDTYLAGFYGKEVTVATLSSWLHLDLRLSPPRTGTKVNITSALDPLIAKVAELGGGINHPYSPPDQPAFNCFPIALTCAAGNCRYRGYWKYDIDDFLRNNSLNLAHEEDLHYGDIFRIGGGDGSGLFQNAPIHYGMILWHSWKTGKIWTFNGEPSSSASITYIALLSEVQARYFPSNDQYTREVRGVPYPEDFYGEHGSMHPTGFYRLNLSVSTSQIERWITDHTEPSSK